MRNIKWGVLGTANIARGCTIPGMQQAENCELYAIAGRSREKAEQFRSEYFDIVSQERETKTLPMGEDNLVWISRMLYFNRKGYFPDYAMDVEIRSGSGKLILAAE